VTTDVILGDDQIERSLKTKSSKHLVDHPGIGRADQSQRKVGISACSYVGQGQSRQIPPILPAHLCLLRSVGDKDRAAMPYVREGPIVDVPKMKEAAN